MRPLSESPVMNFFCKILLAEKLLPLLFKKENTSEKSNKRVSSIHSKEKKCCDCATD